MRDEQKECMTKLYECLCGRPTHIGHSKTLHKTGKV